MLQNMYNDDFHVDIDYQPRINDVNYWKQYQIVHIHRNIGHSYEQTPTLIKFLKSIGIVVIVDLDDYWLPGKEHPIHSLIVQDKIHEKIMANLKEASYVTTTTKIFADEIKKLNKNVVVLPNAINPTEPQFNQPNEESDRIRIGWLGGSSHYHDLKLLDGFVSKNNSLQDKIQYVLCGFDTRGSVTEINQQKENKEILNLKKQYGQDMKKSLLTSILLLMVNTKNFYLNLKMMNTQIHKIYHIDVYGLNQ